MKLKITKTISTCTNRMHKRQWVPPLFPQNIEYWECGVSIKEVDEEFRQYALGFNKYLNEKIVLLYSEMQYVDNIINQYAYLTPYDLNELCLLNKDILAPFASKQKCKIYK